MKLYIRVPAHDILVPEVGSCLCRAVWIWIVVIWKKLATSELDLFVLTLSAECCRRGGTYVTRARQRASCGVNVIWRLEELSSRERLEGRRTTTRRFEDTRIQVRTSWCRVTIAVSVYGCTDVGYWFWRSVLRRLILYIGVPARDILLWTNVRVGSYPTSGTKMSRAGTRMYSFITIF